MWPIERRVLAYLDQKGGSARRDDVVCDLSAPGTRLGDGIYNGTNAGIPRIMGAWCRRMTAQGLILCVTGRDGHYSHHQITAAGRAALRRDEEKPA